MQKICSIILGLFVALVLLSYNFDNVSFAQSGSSGIATYLSIDDQDAQTGDIVVFSEGAYRVSKKAYDSELFGVVVEDPSISFEAVNTPGALPVVSSGKAFVRVSDMNGPIQTGDLITSSSTAGVGQKATEEGYILGVALSDFSETEEGSIESIPVQLGIRYNATAVTEGSNLLTSFGRFATSPTLGPVSYLRYVVAGLSVLIGFVLVIGYFGKIVVTGIEAIGRNPMGGRYVMQSIAINVLLSVVVLIVAFVLSYFLLVVV